MSGPAHPPRGNAAAPSAGDPGLGLEQMRAFVRRHFEDFVNRKKSEVALVNFAEDFVDHDAPGGVAVGPLAAKSMIEAAYAAWPDLTVTVEDILAEGDRVVVRNTWTGTDRATGRRMEFHGFVLWRFARGKIVERRATLTEPRLT